MLGQVRTRAAGGNRSARESQEGWWGDHVRGNLYFRGSQLLGEREPMSPKMAVLL